MRVFWWPPGRARRPVEPGPKSPNGLRPHPDTGGVDPDRLLPQVVPSIKCRVVFSEDRLSSVVLDCIAAEEARHNSRRIAAGSPFSVEAAVGREAWAAAARTVIERWAATDRLVDLQFRDRGDATQVWASDGDTGMLLDLKAHAGA